MTPHANTERYKNYRFPAEIIRHGVWLYYRFTLSYRDVEELMFERGITVSHEAVRQKREILPSVEHRQSRSLNNRCENAHRPTRQREYRMQGFKSAGHAPRFLSAYGPITQHFRPRRHRLSAADYRQEMRQRFASWAEVTGTERAA